MDSDAPEKPEKVDIRGRTSFRKFNSRYFGRKLGSLGATIICNWKNFEKDWHLKAFFSMIWCRRSIRLQISTIKSSEFRRILNNASLRLFRWYTPWSAHTRPREDLRSADAAWWGRGSSGRAFWNSLLKGAVASPASSSRFYSLSRVICSFIQRKSVFFPQIISRCHHLPPDSSFLHPYQKYLSLRYVLWYRDKTECISET